MKLVVDFIAELRRRKVIRVAVTYLVAAWVAMQVVNVVTPALNLPEWLDGVVFLLLLIGFIITVILAWVYEHTPEGWRRTLPLLAEAVRSSPTSGLPSP